MPFISDEEYRAKFEDLHAFAERHGGYEASVVVNGWRLFSDGATIHIATKYRNEPPTNRNDLGKVLIDRAKERLRLEEAAFDRAGYEYAEQGKNAAKYSNLPGVGPEHAECIAAGRDRIAELRTQLGALEVEYADTENSKRAQLGQQRKAEQEARLVRVGHNLAEIARFY